MDCELYADDVTLKEICFFPLCGALAELATFICVDHLLVYGTEIS